MEESSEQLYSIPSSLYQAFSVFYYSVSFISVVGNCLIIFVILRNKRMHNVTNYFITNLAVVDIIISVFSTPFQFHTAIAQRWNYLPSLCKMAPFCTSLNINVSVLTLSTISLERFYVIFYPLKPKLRLRHFFLILSAIWALSIILSSFYLLNHHIVLDTELGENGTWVEVQVCSMKSFWLYRYYLIMQTLIQFIVPLAVISTCFAGILYKIYFKNAGFPLGCSTIHVKQIRNRKKVIKMILIVLVVFFICWTPLQSYNLLQIIDFRINHFKYINIVWLTFNLIAMSNSCYSVIIYGVCSTKFRNEFQAILRRVSQPTTFLRSGSAKTSTYQDGRDAGNRETYLVLDRLCSSNRSSRVRIEVSSRRAYSTF